MDSSFRDLLAYVESGAIAPLRASYAIELAKSGKTLVRRQALPERAFWTAEDLGGMLDKLTELFGAEDAERRFALLFVAVSCHWFDSDHPDPDGFHLSAIAQLAHSYTSDPGGSAAAAAATPSDGASSSAMEATVRSEVLEPLGLKPDCVLLWDFACVPTRENGYDGPIAERGEWSEDARAALLFWLAHPRIALWMQTDAPRDGVRGLPEYAARKYAASGWCCAERSIGELAKAEALRLDLAGRPPLPPLSAASGAPPPFRYLRAVCASRRRPPRTPEAFAAFLGDGKSPLLGGGGPALFDAAADATLASRLYADAFRLVSQRATALDWHGLQWSPADVSAMLDAMPAYGRCVSLDVSCGTLGSGAAAALPRALGALPQLASLCAAGNWVGDAAAAELAEALRSASSLTSLSLDGIGLRERGGVAVLRALRARGGTALQALSLRDNELGLEACVALTSLLEVSPALVVLDAASNQLTVGGRDQQAMLSLLPVALKRQSPLTSLSLGGNGIGAECAPVLASLLGANRTLTALDVRSAEQLSTLSTPAATKLAAAVLASPSLRSFGGVPVAALKANALEAVDLAEECLGAAEAFVLGELLLGSAAVRWCNVDGHELLSVPELRGGDAETVVDSADLSSLGLGTASAIALSSLLSANSVIGTLALAQNRLGERAAVALADMLYFQSSLTSIDLSGNPIGEEGARALGEALSCACNTMSSITIEGGALPVRELRGTKAARTLKLERHGLGPLSAIVIAGLVQSNQSLTSLSLADNKVRADGASLITGALRHTKVVTLDLCNNDVGPEGALAVGRHLSVHHSPVTAINLDGFSLPVRKLRGLVGEEAKPIDALAFNKKKLGPLSGVLIGQLIRTNVALTSLNLSGNGLGPVGGLALARATAANPSLATVDIRSNKLDAEAKAACRAMPELANRLLFSMANEESAAVDGEGGGHGPPKPKTSRQKSAGVAAKDNKTSRDLKKLGSMAGGAMSVVRVGRTST